MPQKTKDTPMMQQYYDIKKDYQDAFLFYRVGDFYELFGEDAIKGSRILELTLTARNKNADDPIPMCGVPHHAAQNYIDILVDKGYKVAICEQVEDPKDAEGMVKREVIQLVTPGTVMDTNSEHVADNNYITAVIEQDDSYGLAYADLTTGEIKTTHLKKPDAVMNELYTLNTKETVSNIEQDDVIKKIDDSDILLSKYSDIKNTSEVNYAIQNLDNKIEIAAVELLVSYLVTTQKRSLGHLQKAYSYNVNAYLNINYSAQKNLELFEASRSNKKYGSLWWVMDKTKTAMGARLLKQWINKPIMDEELLSKRQNSVQTLLDNYFQRSSIQEYLNDVYDLERLAGRIAYGNVNARDLLQLKQSLQQIPLIKDILLDLDDKDVQEFANSLEDCSDLVDLIENAIIDAPPISVKEGGIIKDGFNKQLDTYRDASKNGKQWVADLQASEREKTGINSLKVGYNKVFGYYIEVTKANAENVPEDRYQRKQTLTNSERYITPELKEQEKIILEANEKSDALEYELFSNIRQEIQDEIAKIQSLAQKISTLDVIQSFAELAEQNDYVKPVFNNQHKINIDNSRHPVVEQVIGSERYIPNDFKMEAEDDVLIITGPNMSGKSTYMRQLALTVIMAQIGSFVPAEQANLPIFDNIFTRIGAADDLVSGDSTFMVEMKEANNALTNATPNSLIIFDEIGRGTSTYDGMAIAQAMVEYIATKIHAKTLFSTHYHELTQLDEDLESVKNVHVDAVEENGTLVFLHKVLPGPADKSYGIHVAKLAGLPDDVLNRSQEILTALESNTDDKKEAVKNEPQQIDLFVEKDVNDDKNKAVVEEIKRTNLMNMTPLDAINKLSKWQKDLE